MIQNLLIVALASAAISFTITWTSIFKWLRDLVGKVGEKPDELINCPWCFNHYVCLAMLNAPGLNKYFINADWPARIGMWFACVCIGGLVHYVLLRAYEPVAEATIQRKIERARRKEQEQEDLTEDTGPWA